MKRHLFPIRPSSGGLVRTDRLLAVACVAAVLAPLAVPAALVAAPGRVPREAAARSWAVRPGTADGKPDARTHFTLQSNPGDTLTDQALVSNLGTTPVTLSVYGTDAFNTPDGQFDLLAGAQPPTDVGSWIVFAQKAVTVPAKGTVAVPFKVVVPATATPGDHAGGVVASLVTAGTQADKQVNVDTRVAVRLYLRVPGNLQPRLTVGPVNVKYHGTGDPFGDGKIDVTYTVTNPGNIRLQSHPTIKVTGPFGDTVASLTPKDLPELLPRQHATFTATVDHVFPEGPLTVKVTLAPFTDPLQPVGQTLPSVSGEGYLWAIPWSLLLLILIVLLLLGLLFVLRRRRLLRRLDRAMLAARDSALQEKTKVGSSASTGKQGGKG